MPVDFSGTWKLEKDENLDEFLKAMGVGMIKRTAAAKMSPTLEITQNGDDFQVIMKTPLRNQEVKFKVGEEFTAQDPLQGKEMKMLATWEGDKQIIKNVTDPDGVVVTRELEDGKLVQMQSKGGVTCKRIFKK